jgi:uncharacterized MnhB-related membrane protein
MSTMNAITVDRKNMLRWVFLIVLLMSSLLMCSTAHADNPGQGAYTSTVCGAPIATANGFVPLACYSNSPQFTAAFNSTTGLPQYINNIFTIALSVGAILAVLRIAYGGYMYMGSADMWGNKQQAKEIIGEAIIGLLLLFAIFLILNQINPNLLNLNILKDITPATATTNAAPTSNTPTYGPTSATTPLNTTNADGNACPAGNGLTGTLQGGSCIVNFAPGI